VLRLMKNSKIQSHSNEQEPQAGKPIDHNHYSSLVTSFFHSAKEIPIASSASVSSGMTIVHIQNVLSAIDHFLFLHEVISDSTVRYFCMLEDQNRLDSFIASQDDVIIVTPKGRSIRTKTLGQHIYIDMQRHNELVLCVGPAGTGKTFLGVAMAVAAFRNREVSRIILARPAVEAGERLGFLPGDIQEKVDPYMRPIYDALHELLGEDSFRKYADKGLIEVSPLAFMRGRTLDDAFILLDEAQNATVEQMKMFVTRIGMNARACVCGDITQIDLQKGMKSGLIDAVSVLENVPGIGIVSLSDTDIVRNPLVQRIIRAYNSIKERGTLES
jgi:phosphate starvation-inducible PhoH-like protein